MPEVTVRYKGGLSFEISARGHSFVIDLPAESGGGDAGMTPPEHLIASLGACIGVYIARYCNNIAAKHPDSTLNVEGMQIRLSWKYSDDKTRIGDIDAKIDMPNAEPGKRASALLDVARHCLIHETLENHPVVTIALKTRSSGPHDSAQNPEIC